MVVQRIGQDVFRDALMDYWGLNVHSPTLESQPCSGRLTLSPGLDVHNGLLLSALWDAAFDKGLVSFADDGTVLESPNLGAKAREALSLSGTPRLPGLREGPRANLALHRRRNRL
jgi:hypothetical protein